MPISGSLPAITPFFVPSPRVAGSQAAEASPAREAASPAAGAEARRSQVDARSTRETAQLDEAELDLLRKLKARDREVRAHEQAHQAVGGAYAGAVSYTYQRGPDGAQYAVGGEVSIDVAPVAGDPQATIDKMRTVRAAALAPAEPSGQDRAVAAQAMQLMLQAQTELAMMRLDGESKDSAGASAESQGRPDEAARAYRVVDAFADGQSTATSPDRFNARA